MNIVSDIIDFNQLILGIEPRELDHLVQNEFDISVKCLHEEVEEFIDSHHNQDIVGCVDAILDNIYFAVGVLYKMGLSVEQINQCFAAIHLANMTKVRGTNSKRDTGAADAVKDENWEGPELRIMEILNLA